MSSSTYTRLVIAVVLLLAGCGSAVGSGAAGTGGQTMPAKPARHRVWPCLARFGARETTTRDGIPVALIGHGPVAAVLSNESDQDACGWAPYVAALERAHAELALYDYTSDPAGNVASVARYVGSTGIRDVVLVGASQGAKAAIVAASVGRPTAVVSLSAEAELAGEPVARYAARLRTPTLFVSASADPYGATAASRLFHRLATGSRLLLVPGSAHGTALLRLPAVRSAVLRFLAARDA